jgi:6-phosphogluconolactonase (cycloisomerase 2 family)
VVATDRFLYVANRGPDTISTFTLDGRYAIPSTGEIVDARTKRIVHTLADERGLPVASEKVVEVIFSGDRPERVGDQFGIGRRVRP